MPDSRHDLNAATMARRALPLAGIRVLEFCHTIMGPTAGLILADLGADVVKVEPAGRRYDAPPERLRRGILPHFQPQQAQPRRRSEVRRRPRAAASAGGNRRRRDRELRARHHGPARLRLCRFSPSQSAPRSIARSKAFSAAPTSIARRSTRSCSSWPGLAYMTGPPGQPLRAGASVVDIMGGTFAVIAILAALRERERTGRGQLVKCALFESTAFLMGQHMAGEAVTGDAPPPMPAREGAWAIYEPFTHRRPRTDFRRHHQQRANGSVSASISRGHDLLRRSRLPDQRGPRPRAPGAVADGRRDRRRSTLAKNLPNCSTASIFRLRRSPSPATCLTTRSLMPAAACWTSTSGGTRAKLPRLPIEMGDHDFGLVRQPPRIGEHTGEILAELGLAVRVRSPRADCGSSLAKSAIAGEIT